MFFFNQKTAYERHMSDWSSDVCSSDLQIVRALAVDLFREIFGGFRADFFIIIIPRAGPFSAPLPIIVARVDRNAMARPRPETGFDPVEWPLRAIGRHRFAQDRRARLALLGGKLVAPLDVLIGQVGKDASHDILISYHDIMSNSPIVAFDKDHRALHRNRPEANTS